MGGEVIIGTLAALGPIVLLALIGLTFLRKVRPYGIPVVIWTVVYAFSAIGFGNPTAKLGDFCLHLLGGTLMFGFLGAAIAFLRERRGLNKT
jgi:hypothetical protein